MVAKNTESCINSSQIDKILDQSNLKDFADDKKKM